MKKKIKIGGRNMNNLRFVNDTILLAEGRNDSQCLLMKMKEENGKAVLKFHIRKMKFMPAEEKYTGLILTLKKMN